MSTCSTAPWSCSRILDLMELFRNPNLRGQLKYRCLANRFLHISESSYSSPATTTMATLRDLRIYAVMVRTVLLVHKPAWPLHALYCIHDHTGQQIKSISWCIQMAVWKETQSVSTLHLQIDTVSSIPQAHLHERRPQSELWNLGLEYEICEYVKSG